MSDLLDRIEERAKDMSNWAVPFDSDKGAYFNIEMGDMFALLQLARQLDEAGKTLSEGIDEWTGILEERNAEISRLTTALDAARRERDALREDALALIEQSRVVFSFIEGDAEAYCDPQYQRYRALRARLWKATRNDAALDAAQEVTSDG